MFENHVPWLGTVPGHVTYRVLGCKWLELLGRDLRPDMLKLMHLAHEGFYVVPLRNGHGYKQTVWKAV
jgi:hypothetical protein